MDYSRVQGGIVNHARRGDELIDVCLRAGR